MVPIKASAGYASNVLDTDWYNELPAFNIPLPQYKEGSYRAAFQVNGDSMLSLHNPVNGFSRAAENVRQANDNKHISSYPDTVKKLRKTESPESILIFFKQDYPVIEQPVVEVSELWEVNSKLVS
jgi:hypothetical protein